jgi:2-hydroxychromene-2-carboxylate isomerase
VRQQALNDNEVFADFIKRGGLEESAAVAGIAYESITDQLTACTEEAIEAHAFGAPTYFSGREIFFAIDCLDFINERRTN